MKIAVDISAIEGSSRTNKHRIRGIGFYTRRLIDALKTYYPEHEYIYFVDKKDIQKDVDLIHFPYFEPFFLSFPLFPIKPIVVTVHDLTPLVFPRNFPPGASGTIKWLIQRYALKKAQGVITDSECSKRDIITHAKLNSEKISVVYLAASSEFKFLRERSALAFLSKKYNLPSSFLLYVGDATWNKNLPRLLEAIIATNIPAVIVGKTLSEEVSTPDNPWNKDLVSSQLLIKEAKNIFVLGFIPIEDLVGIYNLATALLMPSLYEGFGLPILEAMQSGCPVITSREGSIPEIAHDAALYVNAYDTEHIAQQAVALFKNTSLQKTLREKGLNQAKKFTWQKTAEDTIKSYEKVLA